jgi:2-aminoethylphosphonate-pyruvate transaminase
LEFVDGLRAERVVISDFFHTPEPSFRVGCIGAIDPADMEAAVRAMDRVLHRMGVRGKVADSAGT